MKNKILVIMTASVLILSTVFLSVFGFIFASRRKNAFAYYGSENISEGVYRYIVYEMQTNIVNLFSNDVGNPFDSLAELSGYHNSDGVDYGTIYRNMIEARIRSLLVCAYLYDSYDYTVSDADIDSILSSYLTYKTADGEKKTLDDALSVYGFSYRDLKAYATLLYKENRIEKELYGESGEKLKNNADTANLCASFCSTAYHGAKLLFIRTEDRFLVNEDGTVDTKSNPVSLTEAEKNKREADIAAIDQKLSDGTFTQDEMNSLIVDYQNDGNAEDAYYFNAQTDFTLEYYEGLPEVVTAALTVAPGEYQKVNYDGGVCYVLGLSVPSDAYITATQSGCFSDFYAHCADYLFTKAVEDLAIDVTFTDRSRNFDIYALPYDSVAPNYYVLSFS